MAKWDWLTQAADSQTWRFVLRVLLKAGALFVVFNVLFALLNPLPLLGRLSLYNTLLPGRARLPYGVDAAQSYNLSLYNLDAMFASHEVARSKPDDEFRVLLIGDSATWGFLLEPPDTLAGQINAAGYTTADGRTVRAYNVGYPVMSLTKDLLLLNYAMRYDPDLVVWLVTLESFPRDKQLFPPLVQNNAPDVQALIAAYDLDLDPDDTRLVGQDFWERTLIGQRRPLADLLRLQLYGVPWAATGIDQDYPEVYELRQEDFDEDESWQSGDISAPRPLTDADLAFDVLAAGMQRVGNVPILLINEPMFISQGRNSDLRYNFFYPRWAYDDFHRQLTARAEAEGWVYLDLWDSIDAAEFTDSAVHYTPAGGRQLRDALMPMLLDLANGRP